MVQQSSSVTNADLTRFCRVARVQSLYSRSWCVFPSSSTMCPSREGCKADTKQRAATATTTMLLGYGPPAKKSETLEWCWDGQFFFSIASTTDPGKQFWVSGFRENSLPLNSPNTHIQLMLWRPIVTCKVFPVNHCCWMALNPSPDSSRVCTSGSARRASCTHDTTQFDSAGSSQSSTSGLHSSVSINEHADSLC